MTLQSEKLKETAVFASKAVFWILVVVFLIAYGTFIKNSLQDLLFANPDLQKLVPGALNAVVFIVATEVFLLITRLIISNYLSSIGRARESGLILSLYTYIVWGAMLAILASTLFRDFGALITSLGLIGFGVTFALQKPILNFVGWLNIIITRPFGIGDRVEVSGIKGDVISIHTMYTRVQGTLLDSHVPAEKIITIPNEIMLTNPTINYSRMGNAYTDSIKVSITYGSNWRKAMRILERAAEEASARFSKDGHDIKNERRSWKEALDLLQEASRKLRKGFLKREMREQISHMGVESIYGKIAQKPKVTMALGPASIDLEVVYQTDLRSQKATKHEVAKAVLEEIERSDDIEIGTSAMEIVLNDGKRRREKINGKISQWLETRKGSTEN